MTVITAILPALDEADALPAALLGRPPEVRVIVVDNGSTDGTAAVAKELGVDVVVEHQRGFGAACFAGFRAATDCEVIVFMDADATCDWRDLEALVDPILTGTADLVLGRRIKRLREAGSMSWHLSLANAILGRLCRQFSGAAVHDIPPFRAVRRSALEQMNLRDRTYGWPLEMVLTAGHLGLEVVEVPVAYRRRVGTSKVTGTISGTVKATIRMARVLWTLRKPPQ